MTTECEFANEYLAKIYEKIEVGSKDRNMTHDYEYADVALKHLQNYTVNDTEGKQVASKLCG